MAHCYVQMVKSRSTTEEENNCKLKIMAVNGTDIKVKLFVFFLHFFPPSLIWLNCVRSNHTSSVRLIFTLFHFNKTIFGFMGAFGSSFVFFSFIKIK